jgi:5-methylcytosine-specific restriction endonuclease McrA
MAKPFAKPFYNSGRWKKTRKAFIELRISIDGGMCQHCKKELGYIVDHIKELTQENINDPDIALNFNNFQYLCLDCHTNKTFKREKEEERYYFDEEGNVVELPPSKTI